MKGKKMVEAIVNFVQSYIFPFWGIFTFFAGAFLGHRLSLGRDRRKEFNKAAYDFRSKVLSELKELYPIPTNWPENIDRFLRAKFPKLQVAVNEFKPLLPKKRQAAFEKAWSIYRIGEDGREIDKEVYWQYMPFSGSSVIDGKKETYDNRETYQDNFKRNIDDLLKFAKPI